MVRKNSDIKLEERYQDYLRFRNENDVLRIQEQGKMDKIIFNCSIGLIGIGFGFVGIIFKEQSICWLLFSLSILCACLSIISNYYSSWCSVKDILSSNDILDERYQKGKDINQTITTSYSCWINKLNNIAMFFLIAGIVLFFIFVYVNITLKPNDIKENAVQNITISCEGCGRNKPTISPKPQKPISKPNINIQNGAERSKPTISKDNSGNSTSKK